MAKEVKTLQSVLARLDNLETIDGTGYTEISSCQNPQDAVLEGYVAERCPHRIDTDIGTRSKSGGEKPGNALPIAWNIRLWPTDTRHEQQGYADEYYQQHHILAVFHQTGYYHSEEDASQCQGQHQMEEGLPRCQLREVEQARNNNDKPRAHNGIDHDIAQGLAQHNGKRTVVAGIAHWNEIAIGILITGSTAMVSSRFV